MVPGGDYIYPQSVELSGDLRGYPETFGGVLSVDDYQIGGGIAN